MSQIAVSPAQDNAPSVSQGNTLETGVSVTAIDRSIEMRGRAAPPQTEREFAPAVERPLEIPASVREHFHLIEASPNFTSLSRVEQQKLVEALDAVLRFEDSRRDREKITRDFAALLSKEIDGELALLQPNRTGSGRTLLDHLHTLATHERGLLEAPLRDKRDVLVRDLVSEIVHPDLHINQGETATCVPATANRFLAAENPAEYARIISELATTGRAEVYYVDQQTNQPVRSSGMVLMMPSESVAPEGLRGRSLSEAMFQDAAMNMVGGYSDGLYSNQIEVLYEALCGTPFARLDPGSDVLGALKECSDAGHPSMVSLKWESEGLHANHALEVRAVVSASDIERVGGRDIIRVGEEPHQVEIPVTSALRRALSEGEVVILRNPWGAEYPNPSGIGAHTIEQETALFWMSGDSFSERLNFAMVADTSGNGAFGVTEGGSWGDGVLTQFVMGDGVMPLMFDLSADVKKILSRREETARRPGGARGLENDTSKPSEGLPAEASSGPRGSA